MNNVKFTPEQLEILRNPDMKILMKLGDDLDKTVALFRAVRNGGVADVQLLNSARRWVTVDPTYCPVGVYRIHPDWVGFKPEETIVEVKPIIESRGDILSKTPSGHSYFLSSMTSTELFRGFRYGTEVTPHLRFDENCKLLVPDAVRFAQ